MAPRMVLDSHVHLWPQDMANGDCYGWMASTPQVAKAHLLTSEYAAAVKKVSPASREIVVQGVVYIEADARYDEPTEDVFQWAKLPLEEARFLRGIIESEQSHTDKPVLAAIVIWAPMDQPTHVLEEYLEAAEKVTGAETWARVKGVRYLVQGIREQSRFESLVTGKTFIRNLQLLGEKGLSFDVGVDYRSGGAWQLEFIVDAMRQVHSSMSEEKASIFILNHLCKPDFGGSSAEFHRWCKSIANMSKLPNTYMKLSGALSELPADVGSTQQVLQRIKPWLDHVWSCFGSSRIMFGSDWPVCNITSLEGDRWARWADVVVAAGGDRKLDDHDMDRIWKGTAVEAYRIDCVH